MKSIVSRVEKLFLYLSISYSTPLLSLEAIIDRCP